MDHQIYRTEERLNSFDREQQWLHRRATHRKSPLGWILFGTIAGALVSMLMHRRAGQRNMTPTER